MHRRSGRNLPGEEYLLNARRGNRRDHSIERGDTFRAECCSTPEGVIVGITTSQMTFGPSPKSAQRPKASSSGSRAGKLARRYKLELLNARRRHRRDHLKCLLICRHAGSLLNARRRHRRDHGQRPGRPGHDLLLNARRRHRRDHRAGIAGNRPATSAQRPKASSSGSPGSDPRRSGRKTAQRPEASSSGSHLIADRSTFTRRIRSTPEGVIVSITRSAVETRLEHDQ